MPVPYWAALLAVALGGAAIATQAPINARLGAILGDPVAAAATSFLAGFVVLAGVVALRGGLAPAMALGAAPWWVWTGGILGAFYVWAAIWSVGSLGVVTLVAALIFGQLTAALVLDAIGAFGLPQRPVTWTRLLAVGFVAAGLVLSRL